MKKEKGSPVFDKKNIDEILTEKVINHAEVNYNDKGTDPGINNSKETDTSRLKNSCYKKNSSPLKTICVLAGIILLIVTAVFALTLNNNKNDG